MVYVYMLTGDEGPGEGSCRAAAMAAHLLLVHTQDNHSLVPADANQFVDGADTTARQLAKQNETLGVKRAV